ncbi:MAG: polysaccharide biosynthesis protein [[Eubacterium] brachy]|nr:polysaccharide biosynthesis protein [[Eubacterium] brachy]
MNKQSLLKGATILGIAGIFVKLLGAVFRLPLVNWIGDTGMANYGPAYYIYAFLVIVATSGLPVAISKMVSESISIGNYYQAHKVFKISIGMMIGIGCLFSAILFVFAPQIASLMNNKDAALGMQMIAPALILVPTMAAFRGYFQGMQNMKPTAVSQVTEQLFRVVIGLGLAYVMFFKTIGNSTYDRYARGAAGANFGATAGAFGGLLIIGLIYYLSRKNINKRVDRTESLGSADSKRIVKRILQIAVPITIGAAILPVMNLVDSAIVMNRLTSAAGFSQEIAKSLYGQLSGFVGSLINFPQIVTQAVAVSIVPIIAAAHKRKLKDEIDKNTSMGIRMAVIIGYPCAIGLIVLAKPTLLLLYPKQATSAASAASVLAIMAFGIIFLSIALTLVGILQGIGRQMIPVKNMFIGMIFKIILTWILVSFRSINVNGAAIGTVVAYAVSVVLNLRAVVRYTKVKIKYGLVFVRPMVSALTMGVLVFASYKAVMMLLHKNSIATLISIGIGIVVYGLMILKTKAISAEELSMIPKGEKLAKIAKKIT